MFHFNRVQRENLLSNHVLHAVKRQRADSNQNFSYNEISLLHRIHNIIVHSCLSIRFFTRVDIRI